MRVGISSFVLQGGRTGVATYTIKLIQALKATPSHNRYDVIIPHCDRPLLPPSGGSVHYTSVPSLFARPINSIVWHNTVLPRLTQSMNLDILHIPSYRRVPKVKRCKVVATVHDLAPLTLNGKYDYARTFYNCKIVPHLLAGCDHIIAVSHYTKSDILQFVGYPEDKVTVIYPGIDKDTFYPVEKQGARRRLNERFGLSDPYFVYVSRIEHPGKNHVNLIKAFNLFKKRYKTPHKLVLAGAYWPGAEAVFQLAREVEFADDILFTGFIPVQDVVALYSACDLTIQPSLFEGFGFPVIEAAACGAPVIASDNTSLRELCAGHFPVFDPLHPEAICAAIREAVNTPPSQAQKEAGLAYAKGFDWHKTVSEVLKVYEQV